MKIDIIAGARPNFVKIAALIAAIEEDQNSSITYRLIHTGQHYDNALSGSFFKQLNIPVPDINFNVGSLSQAQQTGKIMIAYEKVLERESSDLCIVVGDVNSSMACAITAKKMQLAVAHIEAGIRSQDWRMPEEVNRVLIDSITDYFFTTSLLASQHLIGSGFPKDRIHFVGNTMIDTLRKYQNSFKKPSIWKKLSLKDRNYIIITLHRPGNLIEIDVLERLFKQIIQNSNGLPVVFPAHPRTHTILKELDIRADNFHLITPLSYLEFNYLVERAKLVITDSGGITEETTVLKVPCLTLRENTERPETVSVGTNELVGTSSEKVVDAMNKIFSNNWKKGNIPERWDGKAGKRIINILKRLD